MRVWEGWQEGLGKASLIGLAKGRHALKGGIVDTHAPLFILERGPGSPSCGKAIGIKKDTVE